MANPQGARRKRVRIRPRPHRWVQGQPTPRDAAGIVFGIAGHVLTAMAGMVLIAVGLGLSLTFVGLAPGLPMMFVGSLMVIWSLIWHRHPRRDRAGETPRG